MAAWGALSENFIVTGHYLGELSYAKRHLSLQIALHIYEGAAARAPCCIESRTFCPPLLQRNNQSYSRNKGPRPLAHGILSRLQGRGE